MATIITMEPSTPNPNPNPTPIIFNQLQPPFIWPPNSPFKSSNHRRAFSDVSFQFPGEVSDTFDCSCAVQADDIGSDEDIFSKYINVEKFCDSDGEEKMEEEDRKSNAKQRSRPPNRHGDILKSKKAMPANKLAELWIVDPKRAKRILANRQSAARSKERKARYIVELEKRVQSLDIQATTLSTHLNLYQRDVVDLAAENAELKLQLQTMEHQMQLRQELNEALKREVERLRIATGEVPLNQCGTHPSLSCVPAVRHSNDVHLPLSHMHHQTNNDYYYYNKNNPNENLVDDDLFSCSLEFDITKIGSPTESNTTVLLPPTTSA